VQSPVQSLLVSSQRYLALLQAKFAVQQDR
jgi:hypothetical protein